MGTLGAVNNSIEESKFSTPTRRLRNPPNYSSGRMLSIAEIGDKGTRENNPESSEAFAESHGIGNDFVTGFQVGPWDDTEMMPDNVSGVKRFRDNDAKPSFSGLNAAAAQVE